MNSNVLEGMACPSCGSDGPFQIRFTALGSFSDDGGPLDGVEEVDWDNQSTCSCCECTHHGRVVDFRENRLNDRQRALIAAYRETYGTCWLGLINPHHAPDGVALRLWEYDGGLVYNFGAAFVVPRYDWVLDALILGPLVELPVSLRDDFQRITRIIDRVHQIGGDVLVWN